MEKAIKEAKVHTSWITPNAAYEDGRHALRAARTRRADRSGLPRGLRPLRSPQVARAGMVNSLAQLVDQDRRRPACRTSTRASSCGTRALVDPDNRRPVDWTRRRHLLNDLDGALSAATTDAAPAPGRDALAGVVADLVAHWPDGRIKLFLTAVGARARRARPDLFLDGDYRPLEVQGARSEHVIAFARHAGPDVLVAIVPRLTAGLPGPGHLPLGPEAWADTVVAWPEAAPRPLRDLLTGRRIEPAASVGHATLSVADALAICPVALLWAEPG